MSKKHNFIVIEKFTENKKTLQQLIEEYIVRQYLLYYVNEAKRLD